MCVLEEKSNGSTLATSKSAAIPCILAMFRWNTSTWHMHSVHRNAHSSNHCPFDNLADTTCKFTYVADHDLIKAGLHSQNAEHCLVGLLSLHVVRFASQLVSLALLPSNRNNSNVCIFDARIQRSFNAHNNP